jgi:Fe-S-cluster-containing dehydrogenase component/CRP-like cAMP-binding protein
LARWWSNPAYPEVRSAATLRKFAEQAGESRPRIFLQDIPNILGHDDTVLLNAGEVFGELAALTRTPRSATILAEGDVELLEIRWQGLRDILRYDAAWKQQIDALYRVNSLRVHLRETPLLQRLSPEALQSVADATEFLTFGNFDWQNEYRQVSQQTQQQRVLSEPLIAGEGEYPNGLLLIRNGFARLSRKQDSGERTLAYLGKGDGFGMRELASNWRNASTNGWNASLRAVGYVDLLRIPTPVVEQYIFPTLDKSELSLLLNDTPSTPRSTTNSTRIFTQSQGNVDTSLMEFLVENRFLNGTAAMVIDLDRCTRCDDCVKACASTHGNNPRFNREGPKHEKFMIAHACMHCADPVCMIGCPTGAIHREANSGLVVINDDTCIGCTTCANSCPYQNIQMVAIRNPYGELYRNEANQQPIQKATKCDFCIGQSGGPACVRACPHEALERVDLHDVEKLARWSQA